MQETDVRRGFGNDLAIEFEHESQYPMSGRVRWPHIKDHLFADVVIVCVPQLRVRPRLLASRDQVIQFRAS